MKTRVLLALALVLPAIAGCIDSGGSQAKGTLSIAILDTVTGQPVELVTEGAWGLTSGEAPAWYRVVESNNTWQLVGSGQAVALDGTVPAGSYQGMRLAFSAVERADGSAILVESGFDLPLGFQVDEGAQTVIEVGFAWEDALFESKDGLAFRPALKSLRIVEGGLETESLSAQEIAVGGTKPPVARMRVFDPTGLEVFESDFVAESRTTPVIANPGNLTFAASASEALHPSAEIESYEWLMPDGTTVEGLTVEYPLTTPGNQTVRLTVTDSAGGTDSQSIVLALRPPLVAHQFPFSGTLTGANDYVAAYYSGCGTAFAADIHEFDVNSTTLPDGALAAGIGLVRTYVKVDGLGYTDGAGATVAMSTRDGAGVIIHQAARGVTERTLETVFVSDQPADGSWRVAIGPCSAFQASYEGYLEVSWLAGEDPGYIKWLAQYDDGHDHQH